MKEKIEQKFKRLQKFQCKGNIDNEAFFKTNRNFFLWFKSHISHTIHYVSSLITLYDTALFSLKTSASVFSFFIFTCLIALK